MKDFKIDQGALAKATRLNAIGGNFGKANPEGAAQLFEEMHKARNAGDGAASGDGVVAKPNCDSVGLLQSFVNGVKRLAHSQLACVDHGSPGTPSTAPSSTAIPKDNLNQLAGDTQKYGLAWNSTDYDKRGWSHDKLDAAAEVAKNQVKAWADFS